MNFRLIFSAFLVGCSAAHAGGPLPVPLDPGPVPSDPPVMFPPALSGWEIGLGASPIVGVEVNFTGLGQWNSPVGVPPLTGTVNRFYNDGFNRVDATGNARNLTSFWSYQNAAQYNPSGAGTISMSVFNSSRTGSVSEDDAGWGGELFAYKSLGELQLPFASIQGATWGLRLGFQASNFSFDNSGTLSTGVNVITDTFSLGGAVAPGLPFSGSPNGRGNALLTDQPVRTATTMAATVTGSREFDATLFGFSAGPYVEVPVANGFSVRAEAGLSLAIAHGEYSFSSLTTVPGIGAQASTGSSSETELLPGIFAGVAAVYQLNPGTRLIAGLRYQFYDDFSVGASGSTAELELSSAIMALFGASYSF